MWSTGRKVSRRSSPAPRDEEERMMPLSDEERTRYQRQMMIHQWGEQAQQKLKQSIVFIAGAGGLGSPVAVYLAAAGVGQLRVCDCDTVELSNLNRQILHDRSRVGARKVDSAHRRLAQLNDNVRVVPIETRIDAGNVDELVGPAHAIVDCTDNFEARYALNDAGIRKEIPLVHGSVWGLEGRLCFIHVPRTPCLRCVFPEAPSREAVPVVGATAGVIGSLQALEVLKYLTGIGENLLNTLLAWDGATMVFQRFRISQEPVCPSCRNRRSG
jgi:molybdopterin/thiamine biosynthesis adenylyltransferase